ncbi:NAD(P)H-hydrate epimerase,Pyridoxine/pyridoxamine 5'-phosphate oxidase 1, chloroplastic,YjeF N-terminal domain-containing protein 3 [Acanthosepion pharaonis]|uniref:NAD(P)H-hydrate epimerase n=1 Tax=Acanthosepion pharaonis TaxID=158019 RepID=A0A812E7Q7_ACAPH|nr:NAD(P)H-hydrate epimerase,Pyridoxine/pyridoxamine 5'-phosphate oxidase 1, chloroplastic,YjeF N-terminal domain-containing protein 3 [Sepia pharaonis]
MIHLSSVAFLILLGLCRGHLLKENTILNQEESQKIEEELLTEYAFSLEQILELEGYSCAVAIAQVYPLDKMSKDNGAILVCCGPGNNGAHGLVCARHLKHFGYKPSIFYPKTSNKQIFENLRLQCERMDMPFLSFFPSEAHLIDSAYNLVIDAIYGIQHAGPVKGDFGVLLETLKKVENPICSIDIPSGWDNENDNPDALQPAMLISLKAPKLCARHFHGTHHYLGGRYIPRTLELRNNRQAQLIRFQPIHRNAQKFCFHFWFFRWTHRELPAFSMEQSLCRVSLFLSHIQTKCLQ